MLAYQRGDAGAFEVLYARHKSAAFAFLKRSGAPADVVEELFQEAWMAIIRNIENYQPSAKFKTYLYQVAHRKLIDHWRRSREFEELDEQSLASPESETGRGALNHAEQQQLATQLMRQLQNLPEEQRCAVLLRQQGFTQQEIAEITDVGAETVKSRLRYATKSLRDSMGGLHYG